MFTQMYEEKYMRFPEGRAKALTFSYDDGVVADVALLELFNRYGLKGTFNLNTLLFGCREWHNHMDEAQTLAAYADSGHEVALHGARHIFLNKVPLPEAVNEIVQNRVKLEEMFNRIVRGMAYAYNGYNGDILDVLPKLGVEYARTTEDTNAFSLPENFYLWRPTCHHRSPDFPALCDKFLKASPESEKKHRESLLFFVWGHSYEFDEDDNWSLIEGFAQKAGGRKDIWYATNIEICEYIKAYRALVYSIDGERVYNPTALPVWVEIRGKTYKVGPAQTVAFDK